MEVRLANSDLEIQRCHHVMSQLRTFIEAADFVQQVSLLKKEGYQLVFCEVKSSVIAVAGFRILNSLSWQKYVYVHDLVVDSAYRSQGYGECLLQWVINYSRQNGCQQLHLDSGVQRFAAHRFYLSQYLEIKAHHFSLIL